MREVKADPVSAFGGIVAFNRVVDEKLAKEIREFRCGFVGKDQHRCVSMVHTVYFFPLSYRGGAPPTGWPHTNSRAEPEYTV